MITSFHISLRKYQQVFLACFALLFMIVKLDGVQAQEIKVIDNASMKPVPNVAIFNQERNFSTLTDDKGVATITDLDTEDTLTFQHPSYYTEDLTLAEIAKAGNKVYLIEQTVYLEDFVVAVNKTKEVREQVANRVEIIQPKDVKFESPPSAPGMLETTGNVFVRDNATGGGSPIIRGFAGNKSLVVVDGVRQNHAITSGSGSRIVNTIDPAALKRTEVVYGPGSLIYGSDAIGGVLHFYTKDAQLSTSDSISIKGNAFTRYATVNNERTAHADVTIGGNEIASFTSATYSDFQNLRTGNIHHSSYPEFGKRFSYQKREDSLDEQIINPDHNRQRFTQYDRLFVIQKFRYRPNKEIDLGLNFQATSTSSQPNYGQLTEPMSDNPVTLPRRVSLTGDSLGWDDSGKKDKPLAYSEWRYGPSTKYQAIATASLSHAWLLYDEADIVGAYQRIDQERITRYFGSPWRTYRQEMLNKYTLNIDATKAVKEQLLQYGLEATYNDLASNAYRQHLYSGDRQSTFTRYPAGGGTMQTYSAYLKFNVDFSDELRLTQGFRYSKINMSARFDNKNEYFDYTFDEISLNTSAFSGAFNFTYTPVDAWKFSLLGSSGYRVPNLDDAARFSSPDYGTVIVPNPKLKPEYAYNIEASIEGRPIEQINAGVTGYATFLNNAIVRQPYQLNNRDTIEYEGVDSRVLAKVNIGTGFIGGGSLFLDIDLNKYLSFHNRINYAYGRNNETGEPLPHIPPLYGKSALRYGRDKVKVATSFRYNGWKRAANFSPYGADNLDEATVDGTPAWWTLNVKASYRFNEHISLQAALENIFDRHYRPFGSEVSAPGRNFVITLRGSF